MSKHTRAPWEWWTSNGRRSLVHKIAGTQIPILIPTLNRAGHADLMVNQADMALIAVAPDLLALARRYADECGECHGTGRALVPRSEPPDYTDCPDCADIRSLIDKAEGRT